jgi:DNA-binding MarR family transcriptional regulator
MIDARQAVDTINACRDNEIVVTTMTGLGFWPDAGPRDFRLLGLMGAAASVGLGIAIARPDEAVWVIDGDGSLMMQLGVLAAVADAAPPRFVHIVIDNRIYAGHLRLDRLRTRRRLRRRGRVRHGRRAAPGALVGPNGSAADRRALRSGASAVSAGELRDRRLGRGCACPGSARAACVIIKASMTPSAQSKSNDRPRTATIDERRILALRERFPEAAFSDMDAALAIGRASVAIDRSLAAHLRPYGLTPVALQTLISVFLAGPGPLSLSDLGDELRVTKANVSLVLGGLERHKLITRKPYPNDGRKIQAAVTKRGENLLGEVLPGALDAVHEAFGPLSKPERSRLKGLAQKVG